MKNFNIVTYDLESVELDKFIYPIWCGNVSFAEAVFVRENSKKQIEPLQLLYPIDDVISVRSADLKTLYEDGKDYRITSDGKLEIIPGGSIPFLEYEKYHFPNYASVADALKTKFPSADDSGWGYIRAEIGKDDPGMSRWAVAVTYRHSAKSVITPPCDKSGRFKSLREKLERGENIKVVSIGDSITHGCSASGLVNIPPFCPPYNKMVCQFIEEAFNIQVEHVNLAISGKNSDLGIKRLEEICAEGPDLVLLAFGMNDGCGVPTESYVSNINAVVDGVFKGCPTAKIVVIGTCLPNAEVGYTPGVSLLNYHIEYSKALTAEEKKWSNAAFADVTSVNVDMLLRKTYQDTAGSNSNHPNDYMHRVYAQVVLTTIFGKYI